MLLFVSGSLLIACQANWKIDGISSRNAAIDNKKELGNHPEIVMLLGYFRFLDSLSGDALELERARTRKTLAKFHDPIHRLRLAMILSLPLSDSQDYGRALELLTENLERDVPLDPTLRDFSLFLSASIRQLKKQDERYQDLEQTLLQKLGVEKTQSETLAQKLKKLKGRNKVLSHELKGESAQRKNLQKMIDDLKIVEKNIIIRDKNKSDDTPETENITGR